MTEPHHSSREMDLELQIYDKVSLVRAHSQGDTAEGVEYNQLSRQAYPRKQSLPLDLGVLPTISQYSALNNKTDSNGIKPGESTPVYSVPDAKKRRGGHWKKKQSEKEATMAASRKASSSSCPPLPLLTDSHELRLENGEGRYKDVHGHPRTEHRYAVLEQPWTQQTAHVIAQTEPELQRTKLQLADTKLLEVVECNGEKNFQMSKPDKGSTIESHNLSRDMDLELQIYDKVSLVRVPSQGEETKGVEYHQLSRPAYPRKQSLPVNLGALPTISQYSALNSKTDSEHSKPVESAPLYSVPEVKKKRGQWKKKQSNGEATMAASRKVSSISCPPLPLLTESEGECKLKLENDDGRYTDVRIPPPTGDTEHTYAVLEQHMYRHSKL